MADKERGAVLRELAIIEALFQARTVATVMGADPNAVTRNADGTVTLTIKREDRP